MHFLDLIKKFFETFRSIPPLKHPGYAHEFSKFFLEKMFFCKKKCWYFWKMDSFSNPLHPIKKWKFALVRRHSSADPMRGRVITFKWPERCPTPSEKKSWRRHLLHLQCCNDLFWSGAVTPQLSLGAFLRSVLLFKNIWKGMMKSSRKIPLIKDKFHPFLNGHHYFRKLNETN